MISTGQLVSERVMLKNDQFFAVSARDGSMRPGEFGGDGLWSGDTRILSTFQDLVDGVRPDPVAFQPDNPCATFQRNAGAVPVTRLRLVDAGLHERFTRATAGSLK